MLLALYEDVTLGVKENCKESMKLAEFGCRSTGYAVGYGHQTRAKLYPPPDPTMSFPVEFKPGTVSPAYKRGDRYKMFVMLREVDYLRIKIPEALRAEAEDLLEEEINRPEAMLNARVALEDAIDAHAPKGYRFGRTAEDFEHLGWWPVN